MTVFKVDNKFRKCSIIYVCLLPLLLHALKHELPVLPGFAHAQIVKSRIFFMEP
jgi:hypothetical protein